TSRCCHGRRRTTGCTNDCVRPQGRWARSPTRPGNRPFGFGKDIPMDLNLSGRRALVTGGTRGIGRAIVTGLLDEGAQVAFCARTADAVDATAIELADRGRVMGSAVD